jgi:molybdate transport repressor ModE-like protein
MLKISISPQWKLDEVPGAQDLPRLIALLRNVEERRGIAAAASALGLSYRYAWGLIRQGHRDFGARLLDMSRGRRATLTPLGKTLISADRRIQARLSPLLDSLASELEAEIERSRSGAGPVPRIHASHGYAMELLRDLLLRRDFAVDIKYRGSMEALASLAGADCELAGFHLPLGSLQGAVLDFYSKWIDAQRQVLINLSTRRQGIMVAPGNPKGIGGLADLARQGLRFVNRQFGSGTRILLDLLLKQAGLESSRIAGYESGEFTHSAVAACISSGLADAGFGVETGARQFKLDFIPVVSERYFLICSRQSLELPLMRNVLGVISGAQFRSEAARLPGVDVAQAGATLSVAQALPGLAQARPKRPRAKSAPSA